MSRMIVRRISLIIIKKLSFLNPLNPSGPYTDHYLGVSETRMVRIRTTTIKVSKSSPTRVVCVQTIVSTSLLTLGSPQETIWKRKQKNRRIFRCKM